MSARKRTGRPAKHMVQHNFGTNHDWNYEDNMTVLTVRSQAEEQTAPNQSGPLNST